MNFFMCLALFSFTALLTASVECRIKRGYLEHEAVLGAQEFIPIQADHAQTAPTLDQIPGSGVEPVFRTSLSENAAHLQTSYIQEPQQQQQFFQPNVIYGQTQQHGEVQVQQIPQFETGVSAIQVDSQSSVNPSAAPYLAQGPALPASYELPSLQQFATNSLPVQQHQPQPIPQQQHPSQPTHAQAPAQTQQPLFRNQPIQPAQVRTITQQVPYPVPQPYQVIVTKEVPVPKPYPVEVIKEVPVRVEVRVPVEVPKPYEVKVPHPVPVPVKVKVPVEVPKPYAVTITKTVAVPVEKPIYIRVPHPVKVPVPEPYPVPVPQPVRVNIPTPVVVPEGEAKTKGLISNIPQTPEEFNIPQEFHLPQSQEIQIPRAHHQHQQQLQPQPQPQPQEFNFPEFQQFDFEQNQQSQLPGVELGRTLQPQPQPQSQPQPQPYAQQLSNNQIHQFPSFELNQALPQHSAQQQTINFAEHQQLQIPNIEFARAAQPQQGPTLPQLPALPISPPTTFPQPDQLVGGAGSAITSGQNFVTGIASGIGSINPGGSNQGFPGQEFASGIASGIGSINPSGGTNQGFPGQEFASGIASGIGSINPSGGTNQGFPGQEFASGIASGIGSINPGGNTNQGFPGQEIASGIASGIGSLPVGGQQDNQFTHLGVESVPSVLTPARLTVETVQSGSTGGIVPTAYAVNENVVPQINPNVITPSFNGVQNAVVNLADSPQAHQSW